MNWKSCCDGAYTLAMLLTMVYDTDMMTTMKTGTAPSPRVRGHARRIQAANVHGTGMYRMADQYDVTCGCGQWHDRVMRVVDGHAAHDAHKRAVLSGEHVAAVRADYEARLAKYDVVLRDIEAGTERALTREQVEEWVTDARAVLASLPVVGGAK